MCAASGRARVKMLPEWKCCFWKYHLPNPNKLMNEWTFQLIKNNNNNNESLLTVMCIKGDPNTQRQAGKKKTKKQEVSLNN